MAKNWGDYWGKQRDPRHIRNTDEIFRDLAAETAIMMDHRDPGRVVEIGCGDGAVFGFFGFDPSGYVGVDLSASMIDEFGKRYPGLRLVVRDGSDFSDASDADTVLVSASIQYFDRPMERRLFANAARMLKPGGLFVITCVPWTAQKTVFQKYAYEPGKRRPLWKYLAIRGKHLVSDPVGRWFDENEMSATAREQGFKLAKFRGCMIMPYRFHVAFERL